MAQTEENTFQQEEIRLNPAAKLELYHTNDPGLSLFRDSFGVFFETERPLSANPERDLLDPVLRLKTGLVSLPRYGNNDHPDLQTGSGYQSALATLSLQFGLHLQHILRLSESSAIRFDLAEDIFARGAYNLDDLSASIRRLESGFSLAQILASYSSGLSYSTIRNRFTSGLEIGNQECSLSFSWSMLLTDLLYSDHLFALALKLDNLPDLSLSYDFASYDSLNGREMDLFKAGIDIDLSPASIMLEGSYGLDGFFEVKLKASIALNTTEHREDSAIQISDPDRPEFPTPRRTGFSLPNQGQKVYIRTSESSPVPWNSELLKMNDLSILEIGSILKKNRIGEYYDYERVFDLNYLNMRSPEEFMDKGGICRDYANATANILVRNGFRSKIALIKQSAGTPHAFVVTQDRAGSFYLFDYDRLYSVPGSDSFQEAAAAYAGFLSIYLIDPVTHRVTDVLVTPDAEYLESIDGIE